MTEDVWRDTNVRDTYIPCTCHECGKVFVPPVREMWAYKKGSKVNWKLTGVYRLYFCSWKCLRAYERTHPEPPETRGRKKKKETVTA